MGQSGRVTAVPVSTFPSRKPDANSCFVGPQNVSGTMRQYRFPFSLIGLNDICNNSDTTNLVLYTGGVSLYSTYTDSYLDITSGDAAVHFEGVGRIFDLDYSRVSTPKYYILQDKSGVLAMMDDIASGTGRIAAHGDSMNRLAADTLVNFTDTSSSGGSHLYNLECAVTVNSVTSTNMYVQFTYQNENSAWVHGNMVMSDGSGTLYSNLTNTGNYNSLVFPVRVKTGGRIVINTGFVSGSSIGFDISAFVVYLY